MDEMNWALPPELDDALRRYYTEPVPDAGFAANLEAELAGRYQPKRSPAVRFRATWQSMRSWYMQTLHTRPLVAILVVLLALLAFSGVAYALGRLSGFIPGFGFTAEEGEVLVLAEPVTVTQGELDLRLEQAVSDANRFWTELTLDGAEEIGIQDKALLVLADGSQVAYERGSFTQDAGKTHITLSFPALAGSPREVTLRIDGLAGQDFSIPVTLRSVQPGEVLPVLPTQEVRLESEHHGGMWFQIDQVAPASDRTILQISLHYERPNIWIGGPWAANLRDAQGRYYPLDDITPESSEGNIHVYQTLPFDGNQELTFSLVSMPVGDTLPMFEDFSPQPSGFTFDPGLDPQVGQGWALDETLQVSQFSLHVVGATMTGEPGLVFEFEPAGAATGVML
ncbi:MAG: hypothetical protein GYA17_17260, partial [Chloroflexi bacterium]|nr:hypothetical protein [Chloroflexota bacterium]